MREGRAAAEQAGKLSPAGIPPSSSSSFSASTRPSLGLAPGSSRRTPQFMGVDPELLWRRARAAYCLAMQQPLAVPPGPWGQPPKAARAYQPLDPARKRALLDDAMEAARAAVRANPTSRLAQRWCGLVLLAAGEHMNFRDWIDASFEAEDRLKQALQIDPSDAAALHVLGTFYYDAAGFSWWFRWFLASCVRAPPAASYADAVRCFLRAEGVEPNCWKKNQLMLARAARRMGRADEAKKWAGSALLLGIRTPEDAKAHADAIELLSWVVSGGKSSKAWKSACEGEDGAIKLLERALRPLGEGGSVVRAIEDRPEHPREPGGAGEEGGSEGEREGSDGGGQEVEESAALAQVREWLALRRAREARAATGAGLIEAKGGMGGVVSSLFDDDDD